MCARPFLELAERQVELALLGGGRRFAALVSRLLEEPPRALGERQRFDVAPLAAAHRGEEPAEDAGFHGLGRPEHLFRHPERLLGARPLLPHPEEGPDQRPGLGGQVGHGRLAVPGRVQGPEDAQREPCQRLGAARVLGAQPVALLDQTRREREGAEGRSRPHEVRPPVRREGEELGEQRLGGVALRGDAGGEG